MGSSSSLSLFSMLNFSKIIVRSGCLLHLPFSGQVKRLNNLKHVMVSSDCSGNVFVMEYDQQSAKMKLAKLDT